MKKKNKLILLLAASAAVAGLAGYFLTTKKGKKLVEKWRKEGKEFVAEMGDLIVEARRAG